MAVAITRPGMRSVAQFPRRHVVKRMIEEHRQPNGDQIKIAGLADRERLATVKKLSPADQQLIASLRPFQGGNDWLYALHVNDRVRKHQRLLTTAVSTKGIAIMGGTFFESDKFAYGGNLADGVVVAELGLFSFPELKVSASICFAEPPFLKGKEVVPTLYQLTGHVEAALKIFN